MNENRFAGPNLKSSNEWKPFSWRTILQLLFFATLSIWMNACGPTSINNYNGPNKVLSNENSQTRGGGGTGDGGGGQGIFCSNEVKDEHLKNRLFVRDIFEAIINHHRTMKPLEGSSQNPNEVETKAIQLLVDSIKFYFGPATFNLEFGNEKFWNDFAGKISFLNEDTPLFPSNDANSPIALPVGCQITQLAYWDESAGSSNEGTLYVDKKRWQQLDQFNKIALLAHEYFFRQARKAGYKNSDFIRFKVGQLLSKEGLPPLFEDWVPSDDPRVRDLLPSAKNGFKMCLGRSNEDPTAFLQFVQYEGKNHIQHFVIPFLESTSINFSLLQSPHFVGFDSLSDENLSSATDLLIYGSDFVGSTGDILIGTGPKETYNENRYDEWFNFWYSGTGMLFNRKGVTDLNGKIVVQIAMEELAETRKPVR